MGGDGRYVLNGNWAVSPPGTYEAAGTRVVYTREAGPEEMLSAAGPTSHDLLLQVRASFRGWWGRCRGWSGYRRGAGGGEGKPSHEVRAPLPSVTPLQVLLREPNPGIEFEFWLPRERYSPFQAQAQAQAQALGWSLRQQQPGEVVGQPPERPAAPATHVPRIPTPAPGEVAGPGTELAGREACAPYGTAPADPCAPCPDTRGRAHRLLHYCGSDFGERLLTPTLTCLLTDPNSTRPADP